MKTTILTVSLSLVAFSANSNPFVGTYLPQSEKENGATCESLAGSFDGRTPYRIEEGWIEYMESGCKLSKPKALNDGSVRYQASCATEGTEFHEKLAISPADGGVVLKGDGWQEYWKSCSGQEQASVVPQADDQANCSLLRADLSDTDGKIARIAGVYECFSTFDNGKPPSQGCKKLAEAEDEARESAAEDVVVGTRLYRVAYGGAEYFFSEHLQVGSPWYYQGVNPNIDLEAGWVRLRPSEVTEMVEDTGFKFEFGTMSFFNGRQSPEYDKLFGKTFKLKNCG